jgi:hypothetical protein
LLAELFLKIKELDIGGRKYPVHQKNIEGKRISTGISGESHTYRFQTLWMSSNQKNHKKYITSDELEKRHLLERILIGNCLSFFKSINHYVEEQIQLKGTFKEKSTKFKGNKMLAFEGIFTANLMLPDYIGLGKSVARGFGTIKRVE